MENDYRTAWDRLLIHPLVQGPGKQRRDCFGNARSSGEDVACNSVCRLLPSEVSPDSRWRIGRMNSAATNPLLRFGRIHGVLGATRNIGEMEGKAGYPAGEFLYAQTLVRDNLRAPFPRSGRGRQ